MRKTLKPGKINHLHITINKNICGGSPIIKGTRTSVANIAEYYLMGLGPEEIQRELPNLSLAQIFDALAFYFDHRQAIDREIEINREEIVSKESDGGRRY
ncbi:MAG: DUF433 domain-containing protein [Nitrospirota bacterium]